MEGNSQYCAVIFARLACRSFISLRKVLLAASFSFCQRVLRISSCVWFISLRAWLTFRLPLADSSRSCCTATWNWCNVHAHHGTKIVSARKPCASCTIMHWNYDWKRKKQNERNKNLLLSGVAHRSCGLPPVAQNSLATFYVHTRACRPPQEGLCIATCTPHRFRKILCNSMHVLDSWEYQALLVQNLSRRNMSVTTTSTECTAPTKSFSHDRMSESTDVLYLIMILM